MDNLPFTLLINILSYTGYEMMFTIKLVSKRWNKASSNDFFYETILNQYSRNRLMNYNIASFNYTLIPDFMKDKSWKEKFLLKKSIQLVDNHNLDTYYASQMFSQGFYEGQFLNGKAEGIGITYKKDVGILYQGEFSNGKFNGHGIKFDNQDVYEGEFFNNQRHGMGKLIMYEYGKFIGNFKNNQKNGLGKLYFDNGDYFNGNWLDNQFTGIGINVFPGKHFYIGDWLNNKKHGWGILLTNEIMYIGEWVNNKFQGNGKLYDENGIKHLSLFIEIDPDIIEIFDGKFNVNDIFKGVNNNNGDNKKRKYIDIDSNNIFINNEIFLNENNLHDDIKYNNVINNPLFSNNISYVYRGSFVKGIMNGIGEMRFSNRGFYMYWDRANGPYLQSKDDYDFERQNIDEDEKPNFSNEMGQIFVNRDYFYYGNFTEGKRDGQGIMYDYLRKEIYDINFINGDLNNFKVDKKKINDE